MRKWNTNNQTVIIGGIVVFAIAGSLVIITSFSRPIPKVVADRSESVHGLSKGSTTKRTLKRDHAQFRSPEGVLLSEKIASLLPMEVVEEATGEVSLKLLESLQIEKGKRPEVRKEIAKAMEEFKSAEVKYARLVVNEGDACVSLEDCSKVAAKVFSRLDEHLAPIVGESRSNTIVELLKKELRNGGRERMEIGFTVPASGLCLLSKRTLGPNGVERSLDEGTYVSFPDFREINRWSRLQEIFTGSSR